MGRLVLCATLMLAGCGGAESTPPGAGLHVPTATSGSAAHVAPWRSAKVEQLAEHRVEVARKRLLALRAGFEHGTTTLDELFAGFRDVAFAARDSGFQGATLRRILTDYRDAVVALKDVTRERVAKGAANEDAMNRVELLLAEAEFWLGEAGDGH
jgi:hypothetical protein